MRSRYLGFTADKLKDLMKSQFLSGQEIMLKTSRDPLGRSMVNYRIANRGEKARLTSIPMNLFERGRMLRSGKKERGKWVVTRKVPKAAQPYVTNWAREFEKVLLQELGS
jgi:hypothetical protein